MAKNANYVSHKKSKLKNQDGSPQLPSAYALVEGEIAINFAENVETLSIKNESGHVVTFSCDNYYTEKKLGSGFTGQNSANTVTSVIEDNELVWTNAFVALSGITSAHTTNTDIHVTTADKEKLHTHSNKTALDSITGNVDTMAYQNTNSYSSATEVNTALSGKANTATTYTKTEVDARDLWVSGTGENAIVQKGGNNTASGKLSVAMGSGTTASGDYSVAEGSNTTASGLTSHAEGYNTSATTANAHSEGYNTIASGDQSHTEGYKTSATTDGAHAEGWLTLANGDASHAEGGSTSATSYASHAEGSETLASGDYSHAEGNSTSATIDGAHAEGWLTLANGDASHAEGKQTLADGVNAHAEGQSTSATSVASHSEGSNTIASGYASHAEGNYTEAIGNQSHTEGLFTIANNQSEHASGQYNVSSSGSSTFGNSGNTLFSVGNGTAKDARHNAFEIRQNGDIYIVSGNSDIKLQDYIGRVETVSAITPSNSGSTAPIATKVVAENELTVSNALNDLESRKLDASAYTPTSAVTSGSTDVITSGGVYEQMDGVKIKKITQSAYDALVQGGTVDANTLYFITD